MKKTMTILALILALLPLAANAQEENGFEKFDVQENFQENGFNWFRSPLLLAAGDKESSNAMTIGWGAIGTLWGRTALTVYVAEKRYTKGVMDRSRFFTVMAFSDNDEVLRYMGTKSGRDGDKAKALGLHTAFTPNGAPYYMEADMVVECELMYAAPFSPEGFRNAVPEKMYANFPAGIHTEYIGQVVGAWKKP